MRLQELKSSVLLQLAVIYTRYFPGGAFVFASLVKMKGHRFTSLSGALSPINSAAHFFETLYQSGLYWQFIGVGQCVAGLLLLTQRYALLGALMFLPIMANVFVITISYDFAFTPVVTGAMLLATLGLLAWDGNTLRVLVNQPARPLPTSAVYESRVWEILGWLLFGFTALYRTLTDAYHFGLWMSVCVCIAGAGLPIAWARHRKAKSGSNVLVA